MAAALGPVAAQGVELVDLVKELLERGHGDHGARLDDGNGLPKLPVPFAEGEGASLEAVELEVRREHIGAQGRGIGGARACDRLAQGADGSPGGVVLGAQGRPAWSAKRDWSCEAPQFSSTEAQAAGTIPSEPATGRGSQVLKRT